MPSLAPTPCAHPGCHEATTDTRCPEHAQLHAQAKESMRESPTARGYGRHWRDVIRPRHLKLEPWCRYCRRDGAGSVPATVVDHVIPHRGNAWLHEARVNLQSLCKEHHDRKTGEEVHQDVDGLWPLDLPAPSRPLQVTAGWPEHIPPPTASSLGLKTALPLRFWIRGARMASRGFWSRATRSSVDVIVPSKSARAWWADYNMDMEARDEMLRRGAVPSDFF